MEFVPFNHSVWTSTIYSGACTANIPLLLLMHFLFHPFSNTHWLITCCTHNDTYTIWSYLILSTNQKTEKEIDWMWMWTPLRYINRYRCNGCWSGEDPTWCLLGLATFSAFLWSVKGDTLSHSLSTELQEWVIYPLCLLANASVFFIIIV